MGGNDRLVSRVARVIKRLGKWVKKSSKAKTFELSVTVLLVAAKLMELGHRLGLL